MRIQGQNLHLGLSYFILYNPILINKPAFMSLSITLHRYLKEVASR